MPSSAWSFWFKGRKLADEGIRAPIPAFMNWPCQQVEFAFAAREIHAEQATIETRFVKTLHSRDRLGGASRRYHRTTNRPGLQRLGTQQDNQSGSGVSACIRSCCEPGRFAVRSDTRICLLPGVRLLAKLLQPVNHVAYL